eukprot:COSAG06_NODE_22_length_33148_cov_102.016279_10_plen_74_part_00
MLFLPRQAPDKHRENSQKVPFSDQGMITKNVHTLYPAATFDLKPTVLEILGIKPPEVSEQNPFCLSFFDISFL